MKIVALFGKAGAGKDTVLAELMRKYKDKLNLHEIISCTTRPPRQGEKDGVNYYFITQDEFTQKTLNDEMLEASCFNNWWYGTPVSSLDKDKINIGVFNIDGLECLAETSFDILPIYINAPNKIRLIRQLNREDDLNCEEICRRFQTDDKDFMNFFFNSDIDFEEVENHKNLYECVNEVADLINSYF